MVVPVLYVGWYEITSINTAMQPEHRDTACQFRVLTESARGVKLSRSRTSGTMVAEGRHTLKSAVALIMRAADASGRDLPS